MKTGNVFGACVMKVPPLAEKLEGIKAGNTVLIQNPAKVPKITCVDNNNFTVGALHLHWPTCTIVGYHCNPRASILRDKIFIIAKMTFEHRQINLLSRKIDVVSTAVIIVVVT